MSQTLLYALLAACGGSLVAVASLAVAENSSGGSAAPSEAPLAHMVFFKLADPSPNNVAAMVESCHELLTGHQGTDYFSVGVRGAEFDRPVNATDYDVALHLVFANKAAHDAYQTHARHVEFVERNKPLWSAVRVYDSYLAPRP